MNDKQSILSQVSALQTLRDGLQSDSLAHRSVTQLHTAAKALADLTLAKTSDTKERHATRISAGANQYLSSIERTRSDLSQRYAGHTAQLNERFAEAVNLKPGRWADSVLNSFKAANQTDRLAMLAQIVESGDGPSIAALLDAPSFVHGLERDLLQQHQQSMEAKHTPQVFEMRGKLLSDFETVNVALKQAEAIAQDSLNVTDVKSALEGTQHAREAEQRLADATAA